MLKCGFVMPDGDARRAAELAQRAEQSGWDGFFVWEPVWGIDAWVCLAAAAMVTERIRLGTMLTPLSRMRPWKLASETVAVDHLSGGRVNLSVGLGATDTGFDAFGEETDRKTRAELLDEGLDILTGLWKGQPFSYDGKHYKLRASNFMPPPPPVQQPRIPIWVVGAWPREKSMQRVLRYDGVLPMSLPTGGQAGQVDPDGLRQMKAYIQERRTLDTPFDYVIEGTTPGKERQKAQDILGPWIEAGATWWIEAMWQVGGGKDGKRKIEQRLDQGPPG